MEEKENILFEEKVVKVIAKFKNQQDSAYSKYWAACVPEAKIFDTVEKCLLCESKFT